MKISHFTSMLLVGFTCIFTNLPAHDNHNSKWVTSAHNLRGTSHQQNEQILNRKSEKFVLNLV